MYFLQATVLFYCSRIRLKAKFVIISAGFLKLIRPVHDNGLFYPRIEPWHEIFNNLICATSKCSDQPAHTRSRIRAFAGRLTIREL